MSHEKINKFDSWNIQKQHIDSMKKIRYVHKREVWNLALGVNIGDEQNGGSGNFRPVLVLKVFNKNLFLGVPLTSKERHGKFYIPVSPLQENISSTVIISQLRIFDTNRLSKKMGMISKDEFLNIKKTIQEWFN